MATSADSLPTDLAAAHAMIIAQREALIVAEAKAQNAEAEARHRALLIEQMKFTIARLRHEKFGPSSERGARTLRQVRRDHMPLCVGQIGLVSRDGAAMLLSSGRRPLGESKVGSRDPSGFQLAQ